MLSIECALLLLVVPQIASPTLDDALRLVEEGAPLSGQVSRELGREAVARLRPDVSSAEEVAALARIARAGEAETSLRPVLAETIRRSGPGAHAAARALAAFPRAARADLPAGREWFDQLGRLALDDELAEGARETALAALTLAAPDLDPQQATDWLRRLIFDLELDVRAAHLLRELGQVTRSPKDTYVALAQLEDLPASLTDAAWGALRALAHEHPEAAAEGVLLASLGNTGPGGAVIRSLGALAPEHWAAADDVLIGLLDTAYDDLLAAAILSAAELRLPALGPMLPALARADSEVGTRARAEATRAIGLAYSRDGETVDLLLELCQDVEAPVRSAAFEALGRVSRAKLPPRLGSWQSWRRRADLVEVSPMSSVERLEFLRGTERAVRLAWAAARPGD